MIVNKKKVLKKSRYEHQHEHALTRTHSCTAGLGPDGRIVHGHNGAVSNCKAQITEETGSAPDGEAARKKEQDAITSPQTEGRNHSCSRAHTNTHTCRDKHAR